MYRLTLSCLLGATLLTEAPQPPPGFRLETVVADAAYPATFAFTPDGRLLYGELTTGNVRVVRDGVLLPQPFATLPTEAHVGSGLLGLAVDPDFLDNGYVYVYHSAPTPFENHLTRLRATGDTGIEPTVILTLPAGLQHHGGRLGFDSTGALIVTYGENFDHPNAAQDLSSPLGKIHRITRDGLPAPDNPVPTSTFYALGVRNSFGLDFHPLTQMPYFSDNGPQSDDEIDLLLPAANYGWPRDTGPNTNPAYQDPVVNLSRTIGITGIAFYSGYRYPPEYWNDLFFGEFNSGLVQRVRLQPPNYDQALSVSVMVRGLEHALEVRMGTDGDLYISTPTAILRLRPSFAAAIATAQSRYALGDEIPLEVGASNLDGPDRTVDVYVLLLGPQGGLSFIDHDLQPVPADPLDPGTFVPLLESVELPRGLDVSHLPLLSLPGNAPTLTDSFGSYSAALVFTTHGTLAALALDLVRFEIR